jgi:hypothetical protein|tara:strand:+ start:33 stop:263 length:231 start_codon:yes stop_codon:yes gene_type:complete
MKQLKIAGLSLGGFCLLIFVLALGSGCAMNLNSEGLSVRWKDRVPQCEHRVPQCEHQKTQYRQEHWWEQRDREQNG